MEIKVTATRFGGTYHTLDDNIKISLFKKGLFKSKDGKMYFIVFCIKQGETLRQEFLQMPGTWNTKKAWKYIVSLIHPDTGEMGLPYYDNVEKNPIDGSIIINPRLVLQIKVRLEKVDALMVRSVIPENYKDVLEKVF